jgi:hypothetical protein
MKKVITLIFILMTNPALGKVEHGTTIFCPRLDQGFLFETVLELENINNYFNNFKLLLFKKGFDIKDPRIEKFQVKDIYVGYGQSYITEKIYTYEENTELGAYGGDYIIFPGTKLNRNTLKVEGFVNSYPCEISNIENIYKNLEYIVKENKEEKIKRDKEIEQIKNKNLF